MKVSQTAKQIYQWLEFVVMTDQSFNCVENQYYIAAIQGMKMTRKYFMRILQGVRNIVIDDLKILIPENFGVIFDGR